MFRGLWNRFFGNRQPSLGDKIRSRTEQLQLAMLESQLSIYDNLVDLREPYTDTPDFWFQIGGAETVPPNIDSRKRGEVLPVYLTELGLKTLRDQSRRLCQYNEFAINAVENRISYLCGKGFAYKVVRRYDDPNTPDIDEKGKADDALCKQGQEFIDDFVRRTNWGEREQECVRRSDRDGEAIIRFFHTDGEGTCEARFVEPEHLRQPDDRPDARFGVETDPDDVEDVKGYWIIENPDKSLQPTFVPADEVVHIKLNVDSTAKRGVPTLMPVRKNLERADGLLKNMSILAQTQATFALIRKHKNYSASAISAFQQAKADVSVPNPWTGKTDWFQRMQPGSIIDTTENTEYEFPSAHVDAANLVNVLQAELRAVAARLVMPEYMLTADASNNNYASALVAEAPAVKNFERLQSHFTRRMGDGPYAKAETSGAMWRVLRYGVVAGKLPPEVLTQCEIQVEGPSLIARNKSEETTRASTLNEKGILSKATWAKWEGLDYEQEQQQIDQEQPQQGETIPSFEGQPQEVDQGTSPFGQTVTEGCVPNKSGKGHHDDKTGYPCSPGGGSRAGTSTGAEERSEQVAKNETFRKQAATGLQGQVAAPRTAALAIRASFTLGSKLAADRPAIAEAAVSALIGQQLRSGGLHGFDTAGTLSQWVQRAGDEPVLIDVKTSKQNGYDEKPPSKLGKVSEWQQKGGLPAYVVVSEGHGVYLHVGIDPASSPRFQREGGAEIRGVVEPAELGRYVDGSGGRVPFVKLSDQWKTLEDLKKATPYQIQLVRERISQAFGSLDMDKVQQHVKKQIEPFTQEQAEQLWEVAPDQVVNTAVEKAPLATAKAVAEKDPLATAKAAAVAAGIDPELMAKFMKENATRGVQP